MLVFISHPVIQPSFVPLHGIAKTTHQTKRNLVWVFMIPTGWIIVIYSNILRSHFTHMKISTKIMPLMRKALFYFNDPEDKPLLVVLSK